MPSNVWAVGWTSLFAAESNTWGSAAEMLGDAVTGINYTVWGGLLSTLAAVWWMSAIYLRNRAKTVRKIDNPQRLFRELCREQKLAWNEIGLLEQAAEARGLADPALMFVRDDYFETADLEDAALCEHAAALSQLRAKLFASVELGTRNAERETEPAQIESAV